MAGISHLPFVLSAALVRMPGQDEKWPLMRALAADGYRDMSRLAAGNTTMHHDLCLTNKEAIVERIDTLVMQLADLRSLMVTGDETLEHYFAQAKYVRDGVTDALYASHGARGGSKSKELSHASQRSSCRKRLRSGEEFKMAQHQGRCRQHLLFGGLTLALLFVAVSCRQSSGQDSPGTSAPPPAPTYINTAYPRNHVPPNIYWGFAHVTFTVHTTYDQAHTILSQVGVYAYPMVNPPCGDLREAGAPIPVPTAMSPEALQADFQQSHSMLVQTDAWEKLNLVAASPGVVAVNPLPLPKSCPAHPPI